MRYRHTQPNFNFLWENVRFARAERSVRGWYVPLGPPPRGFWYENVIITTPNCMVVRFLGAHGLAIGIIYSSWAMKQPS
jgi:hypothetical protein